MHAVTVINFCAQVCVSVSACTTICTATLSLWVERESESGGKFSELYSVYIHLALVSIMLQYREHGGRKCYTRYKRQWINVLRSFVRSFVGRLRRKQTAARIQLNVNERRYGIAFMHMATAKSSNNTLRTNLLLIIYYLLLFITLNFLRNDHLSHSFSLARPLTLSHSSVNIFRWCMQHAITHTQT